MIQPRSKTTVTAEAFSALQLDVLELKIRADRADTVQHETLELVRSINVALMIAEPGQEHGLLHRLAANNLAFDGVKRMSKVVIFTASVVVACGIIFGAVKYGLISAFLGGQK